MQKNNKKVKEYTAEYGKELLIILSKHMSEMGNFYNANKTQALTNLQKSITNVINN